MVSTVAHARKRSQTEGIMKVPEAGSSASQPSSPLACTLRNLPYQLNNQSLGSASGRLSYSVSIGCSKLNLFDNIFPSTIRLLSASRDQRPRM